MIYSLRINFIFHSLNEKSFKVNFIDMIKMKESTKSIDITSRGFTFDFKLLENRINEFRDQLTFENIKNLSEKKLREGWNKLTIENIKKFGEENPFNTLTTFILLLNFILYCINGNLFFEILFSLYCGFLIGNSNKEANFEIYLWGGINTFLLLNNGKTIMIQAILYVIGSHLHI
jgi:hypothetical protein